jgi:cytochrome bd-type quinol oxidase subunit 2
MFSVYALIYVPIVLFVVAFLYETYLSIRRLFKPVPGLSGYVDATWEVTNTLLVFGVVMLLMLFTTSITAIASAIFTSTMLAGGALLVRAICYIHLFYAKPGRRVGVVDWLFAASHLAAALLLVVTVVKASWLLYDAQPVANLQFVPYFLPGLAFVLAVCSLPLLRLYRTRG